MKRRLAALALLPALMSAIAAPGSARAQPVPELASKQLWCGTALVLLFSDLLAGDLSEPERAEAEAFIADGGALIEIAVAGHAEAGLTPAAIATLRGNLEATVLTQIQSETAPYGPAECMALLPGPAADSSPSPSSM